MPKLDKTDLIRKGLEKGVKLTPIPPDSYMIEGPAGTFIFENIGIADEALSHRHLGTLNITKAWGLVPKDMPLGKCVSNRLLESVADVELDREVLESMTGERLNQPALFVTDPNGMTYLIDGAHRLHVRARRKMKWIFGFHFSAVVLPIIQVKAWKLTNDGARTPLNLMEGVLAHLPCCGPGHCVRVGVRLGGGKTDLGVGLALTEHRRAGARCKDQRLAKRMRVPGSLARQRLSHTDQAGARSWH